MKQISLADEEIATRTKLKEKNEQDIIDWLQENLNKSS